MGNPFSENIRFVQKALVVHPEDASKFLLLIRKHDDSSRPGDYDLPGGSVERNELHDAAIMREIGEETALKVTGIEPVSVSSKLNPETGTYFLYIGYVCKAVSDAVEIDKKEHDGFKWLSLDEFEVEVGEHILSEHVRKAMARYE